LLLYQVPAIHNRLYWRLDELQAEARGFFYPHPQSIATPEQARLAMMAASLTAEAKGGAALSLTAVETKAELPSVTPTATPYRKPVPASAFLPFERFEWEGYNNCGPASVAMTLELLGVGRRSVHRRRVFETQPGR